MTTVRPWASVATAAERVTLSPVCTWLNWKAAAAFALPPAKVTGPEKVTVSDRTSDRWAEPSLTCTAATVGGASSRTIQASELPAGSVPWPAITRPSDEQVSAAPRSQPASCVPRP